MRNRLSPSVLAADFGALREDLRTAEEAGAEIKALRKYSDMFFDVHLMVENPDIYFPIFKKAGADRICFHVEATPHLDRSLNAIKELDMEAGLAVNPATSLSTVEELLPVCSYILLMSVNPGFGGQKFIPYSLDKLRRLREMAEERDLELEIGVDGGIGLENIASVLDAGANFIIAGSSVFSEKDKITEKVEAFNRFIKP